MKARKIYLSCLYHIFIGLYKQMLLKKIILFESLGLVH